MRNHWEFYIDTGVHLPIALQDVENWKIGKKFYLGEV